MIHCLGWMPPRNAASLHDMPTFSTNRCLLPPSPVCHESQFIPTSIHSTSGIRIVPRSSRIKNPSSGRRIIEDSAKTFRLHPVADLEGGREGERDRGWPRDESVVERMEGKRGKTKRGQNECGGAGRGEGGGRDKKLDRSTASVERQAWRGWNEDR